MPADAPPVLLFDIKGLHYSFKQRVGEFQSQDFGAWVEVKPGADPEAAAVQLQEWVLAHMPSVPGK